MERLDVLLALKGYFKSREKAREAIINGSVYVNGKVCQKPSTKTSPDATISISGEKLKYVSRAGLKLEKAATKWNINFDGKIVLDVGASTGGFSDFALSGGAKKVYAVDVGAGQLDEKIKNNPKVVNLEKTDFRSLGALNDVVDIAVCDCSFISLKLLLPKFMEVLQSGKELVVLIKPQFECGKSLAHKYRGVIKDKKLQESIKDDIINTFLASGFNLLGSCDSPILGSSGNREFLAYFIKK